MSGKVEDYLEAGKPVVTSAQLERGLDAITREMFNNGQTRLGILVAALLAMGFEVEGFPDS